MNGRDDFLSGASGAVGGVDAVRRELRDRLLDARELVGGTRLRLARAARREPSPPRRVLVLGVVRPAHSAAARAAHAELLRSRHDVELHTCPPDGLGRFENLNRLLTAHPPAQLAAHGPTQLAPAHPPARLAAHLSPGLHVPHPSTRRDHDWLLTIDDDVTLPRGFLDRLLFLAERLALDLAQPAHRLRSHAAWEVTRRRPGLVAHETRFVEIGPITLFARSTFATLLPFPSLRMGWGLDLHWAALARTRGWRLGVIDAVSIGHVAAPAASTYSREAAAAEARAFLAERPHLAASEAQQTLAAHRRW